MNSYEERQKAVREHLEAQKMNCGGTVPKMYPGGVVPDSSIGPATPPPPQTIGPDQGKMSDADRTASILSSASPTPEGQSIIDTVKAGLSGAGDALMNLVPEGLLQGSANVAQNPNIPNVVNAAIGTNLQTPQTDSVQSQANSPTNVPHGTSEEPPVKTSNRNESTDSSPSKPFEDLFNQDPTKITQGFNPQDRQAMAQRLLDKQRSGGNIISEAIAGLGDAIAARGGVNRDSLGELIKLETNQRQEALGNFDKARQSAIENFQVKTQMGENAIKQLAAKDAYGLADPNLAAQIGAPKGTLNKDLPLYLQIYSAKAGQAIANGNQILEATKQAAQENDDYNKNAGILHGKQTPEERQARITSRANDIVAQARGMVKAQQHGNVVYLPQDVFQKARKLDPSIQQVSY